MSSLRKFLVVGCGGSGAATLAFMMDELKSQLASHGIEKWPAGWQFVDVDVPVTPQTVGGAPPNVQAQGGTYIGLGVNAGTYSQLDSTMSQAKGGKSLDRFGSWALRRPNEFDVPISQGAGQVRSIGRMVAMNKFELLRERLGSVWGALIGGDADMYDVAKAFDATYQPDASPLVIIVSSMAGGAGASMALDVARILATIGGYPVLNVGMYMVAADVFDTLPASARAGVRPNALGMLGEIVAAQTGASATSDLKDLKAAGVAVDVAARVPFKRVFPISAHVGATQRPFGTGRPVDVYRGLARGLAALMTSASASAQYENYDLANQSNTSLSETQFGWGKQTSSLEWGSFGYCALNMGRDRYAEYAAQRLARGAVDALLDGHMRLAGHGEDGATVLRKLRESSWRNILSNIGLYEPQMGQFKAWLASDVWTGRETTRVARDVTAGLTAEVPVADGQNAKQWLAHVSRIIREGQAGVSAEVFSRVKNWLWQYQQGLATRILDQTRDALSQYGISYTLEILSAIATALSQMSSVAAGESPASSALAVPDRLSTMVGGMGKGVVQNGQAMFEALGEGLARSVQPQLYSHLSAGLSEIWRDCADNLVQVLSRELSSKQSMLQDQRDRLPSAHKGLAVVATTEYGLWPMTGATKVPSRFDHAVNEVLITSSAEYLTQFDRDIARAFGSDRTGNEEDAWPQIIAGDWATGDGSTPPRGMLEVSVPWVPQWFDTDPGTGRTLIAKPSSVAGRLLPEDLLGMARQFVGRREMSFDQFCSESLFEFAVPTSLDERAARRALIVSKFRQALDAALPLAGPSPQVVRRLTGKDVQYRYKFSEIPFENVPELQQELRRELAHRESVDHETVLGTVGEDGESKAGTFGEAVGSSDSARRIDVFGSYPSYLPICFTSVTEPIRKQWASSTSDEQRKDFWIGRRARPLPAAMPMGDEERQALIAGWFVGQIVGKLDYTEIRHAAEKEVVRVWDNRDSRWRNFPDPLLTPFSSRRSKADLLPSVLESYLLAILDASVSGDLFESLRPYQSLRSLYDSGTSGPTEQGLIQAELELAELFRGESEFTKFSKIAGLEDATDMDDRVERVRKWVGDRTARIERMQNGPAPSTREEAANRPLVTDLAADSAKVLRDLLGRLDVAKSLALEERSGAGAQHDVESNFYGGADSEEVF